jgi:hypothetical protein
VALTFPTYYTYERFVAAMDSFGKEKQHGESQPGKYTATGHHERVHLNMV